MFKQVKTVCRVTPSLTGWVCITPSGTTNHSTRSEAKAEAKSYDAERRSLISQFEAQQARRSFYQD